MGDEALSDDCVRRTFAVWFILKMKGLLFITLMCLAASCFTSNPSSSLVEEDKLYVTRKYIGDFLELPAH